MKFRRLACGCCKSSDFPSLCKSPTYVMSEVVDKSNVIFLMSERRRRSCGDSLAINRDPAGGNPQAVASGTGLSGPNDVLAARRAKAIIASCTHPSYRPALDDDFGPDREGIAVPPRPVAARGGVGVSAQRTAKRPPPPRGKKTAKPNPSQRELLLPIPATGPVKEATPEQPKKPAVRKPAVRRNQQQLATSRF